MEKFHQELVDQILSRPLPAQKVWPASVQWLVWAALSGFCMGVLLIKMKIYNDVDKVLSQMPSLSFLALAFLGSALAAWEAIASSMPGRKTPKAYRILSLGTLAVLFAIPFLFFARGQSGMNLMAACVDGWACIRAVSIIGLFPWVILGWILSRNASFQPFWTGAWSGLSAFLMAAATVQFHCPNWETGHMIFAHLLPVAFLTFLTTFLGSFWFSRWRK
jgi:hypothetical protein